MMKRKLIGLAFLLAPLFTFAQDFPMQKIEISDWNLPSSGWIKTGEVNALSYLKATAANNGTVLLAKNAAGKISTKNSYGDLKVSFDFLQSAEAQAEIILQNEVRIALNGTKEKLPSGTILKTVGYQLPTQNATKSAGLWQHAEVIFNTAKSAGELANVQKVSINGITVLENIMIPIANTKSVNYPMVIKAISGTSAFKNFEFLTFEQKKPVSIANLSYTISETEGWQTDYKPTGKTVAKTASELTANVPNEFREFLMTFKGTLNATETGLYAFTMDYQGVGKLYIDGNLVAGGPDIEFRRPITGLVELAAGNHDFTYEYRRTWWRPAFGLFVSGPDFRPYALHAANALPVAQMPDGIFVNVNGTVARTIRSFMNFKGEKRTEVISVGTPQKVNYAFDLANGSLLKLWKGDFVDATEMWHERGEPQILSPLGMTTETAGTPTFYVGSKPLDSVDVYKEMVFKSYQLDEAGLPTFTHSLNGISITQKFEPYNSGLKATVKANGGGIKHVLISADKIEPLSATSYLAGDKIIDILGGPKASVISKDGKDYLVALCGNTLTYSINW